MTYGREEIEMIVRQVVTRTLGQVKPGSPPDKAQPRQILDAEAVNQLPPKATYLVPANTLITPLARQAALEKGIRLSVTGQQSAVDHLPITDDGLRITAHRTIAIGADHGGYSLKEQIKTMLELVEFRYTVIDCGTYDPDSVDYPDFAYAVAQLVANGRAWRGIMIDGAGIGSCMAANKVPGVRAAMCYDQATAVNSREHNNANVLTLGAGLIGPSLAKQIVTVWLETDFGGGRHGRRVDKIDAIGKRFSKASK